MAGILCRESSTGGGRAGTHLVGVPQADGAAEGQFPHQQVVHPAEGKLQVSHFVPIQMAVNSLCTTQAQAVREPQGKRTSSTNKGLHSPLFKKKTNKGLER